MILPLFKLSLPIAIYFAITPLALGSIAHSHVVIDDENSKRGLDILNVEHVEDHPPSSVRSAHSNRLSREKVTVKQVSTCLTELRVLNSNVTCNDMHTISFIVHTQQPLFSCSSILKSFQYRRLMKHLYLHYPTRIPPSMDIFFRHLKYKMNLNPCPSLKPIKVILSYQMKRRWLP